MHSTVEELPKRPTPGLSSDKSAKIDEPPRCKLEIDVHANSIHSHRENLLCGTSIMHWHFHIIPRKYLATLSHSSSEKYFFFSWMMHKDCATDVFLNYYTDTAVCFNISGSLAAEKTDTEIHYSLRFLLLPFQLFQVPFGIRSIWKDLTLFSCNEFNLN